MAKTGLLLLNLGTPDDPSSGAVRRYLKAFLSDPRVIDLPAIIRYPLLYGYILPFRPKSSSEAYRAIWTEHGSPLRIIGESLAEKMQAALGEDVVVALGMRYCNPSIASALEEFRAANVEKIIIFPLFPQYASASTGSALAACLRELSTWPVIPELQIISDYFDSPEFIAPQAALIEAVTSDHPVDHVLLSFHGLPERQTAKTHPHYACSMTGACPNAVGETRNCYRAQSYDTARAIAKRLSWQADFYSVGFQSRLGRTPWIKPYTDELLGELASRGIKRLAVACPSFTADCLETLEEIGIRAREQWVSLGGTEFHLIPCVNDDERWVQGIIGLIANDKTRDDQDQPQRIALHTAP